MSLTRTHLLVDYLPRLTRYPASQPTSQAVVHLPGLANNGDITVSDLLPFYAAHGDTFVLNHPRRGYDPAEAIRLIVEAVKDYYLVVLVASSMGGRLIAPILQQLHREYAGVQMKLWWQCGLLSGHDAAGPAGLLGYLSAWPLASRPMIWAFDALLGLRDRLPIEPGVSPQHLLAHRRALRGATPSARRAQLWEIAMPNEPVERFMEPGVYTRAKQVDGKSDGFVRGSAAESVQEYFPHTEVHDRTDLRHCTLVEQPAARLSEAGYVFRRLGIPALDE